MLVGLLAAVWVLIDAVKRSNNLVGWPVAAFFAWPLALPCYLAKRNLFAGETRQGGTVWNIAKNFALTWTLAMFLTALAIPEGIREVATGSGPVDASPSDQELVAQIRDGIRDLDSEEQEAVISDLVWAILKTVGVAWCFVMLLALAVGRVYRQPDVIERGPTLIPRGRG